MEDGPTNLVFPKAYGSQSYLHRKLGVTSAYLNKNLTQWIIQTLEGLRV